MSHQLEAPFRTAAHAEIFNCPGMSQRFTLDRLSFEQVLWATSLIQQLNRQVRNGHVPDQDDTQPLSDPVGNGRASGQDDTQRLSDLVEAQLAIDTRTIDLRAAMNRVVGLALKLSRATGAATWLFTGHEFVYCAGARSGANDERLQLEALSKLAPIRPGVHSLPDLREPSQWSPAYDAIHYPGSVKSLLVVPIYHGWTTAGALAVFSVECNTFTERDATNARLLSGLLTHALVKAAEAELKQKVSRERAAMLQAIDPLIPTLRKLAEEEKQESHKSPDRFPPLFTEELLSDLTTVQASGAIPQETGDRVPGSSDSPSARRVVRGRTEFRPRDCRMLETGKGQMRHVSDKSSLSADPATRRNPARESTCASAPANKSALRVRVQAAAARIQKNSLLGTVAGQHWARAAALVSACVSLVSERSRHVRLSLRKAAKNILVDLWSALKCILDVLKLTDFAHRQLSKARSWLSTAMERHLEGLLSIATYQLRISISPRLRLLLRVLPAAAVVLLIVPVFVLLITTAGHRSKVAVATSATSGAVNLRVRSGTSSPDHTVTRDLSDRTRASEPSGLHQGSGPVPAYQLSHMRVTDPAILSALRNLSHYEIVGLERQARYGDDSAALLLGMAYETGHLVPQDCVKAGEWVTKSANEGNAAAQYNLGLRYRHGDGEPLNLEVAARWLRKAAAQKYSPAQLAVEAVP
jgi:TPR repeat protein